MLLNDEQAAFVHAPLSGRHTVLFAGAGGGKSTSTTARIAELVRERSVDPASVMLVTFTRNSAQDMITKLCGVLTAAQARRVVAGTFHAIARLVTRDPELEVDDDDGYCRDSYDLEPHADELLVDYLDHLVAVGAGAHCPPVRHVFVDEAQDLDPVQYDILLALRDTGAKVTAIGDPRQCIYAFRGSDPAIMRAFVRDFNPVRYDLAVNYRSTGSIVDFANGVMNRAPDSGSDGVSAIPCMRPSPDADLGAAPAVVQCRSRLHEAYVVYGMIKAEAAGGAKKHDIAVLARTNAYAETMSAVLAQNGYAHVVIGGSGEWRAAQTPNSVCVSTVHGAKGLEWDSVYVMGASDGVFPGRGDLEENRRLFFVAATRARKRLSFTYCGPAVSRFLAAGDESEYPDAIVPDMSSMQTGPEAAARVIAGLGGRAQKRLRAEVLGLGSSGAFSVSRPHPELPYPYAAPTE